MKQNRWRTCICLTGLVCLAASAWAQGGPPPVRPRFKPETSVQAIAKASKPASAVFRNIKVLKTIPAGELIPTMRYITVALGVRCTFCHVKGAFYKDTKRTKRTARVMMRMLLAIDGQNFHGRPEVSCYTCHRGSAHPVGIPPLVGIAMGPHGPGATPASARSAPVARSGRPPRVPPSGLPTAAAIEAKYRQALGGEVALSGLRSLIEQGTVSMGHGRRASIRIERRAPDLSRTVVSTPRGSFVSGFDGHTAWSQLGHGLEISVGAQRQLARMQAALIPALDLTTAFSRIRVTGIVPVNGHAAFHLFGMQRGGIFEQLFFGQKSGLLLRMVTYTPNPLGVLSEATDYSDYRAVSGVNIPHRMIIHSAEGEQTITLSEVKANAPLARAQFAPPTPPARPAPMRQ